MADALFEGDSAPEKGGTLSAEERHASWLELFFDLVVVTAVAQISHSLRDADDVADVAILAAVFYAIWNTWVSFTLYANVVAAKTRLRPMLFGMFGIAVMAAAIPDVTGERGTIFIVAYLVTRGLAAASFRQSRAVVTSWSLAQDSAGALLWIISIWADSPARYWLWAAAIAVDLIGAISVYLRPQRFLRDRAKRAIRRDRELHVADIDSAHLEERLGLFVVIVLGEAVAQLVGAASEENWNRPLAVASVLAFWLLVCMWQLTVGIGSGAIPNPHQRHPPPAVLLPTHLLTTAGITAIAAGLGAIAEHSDGSASTITVWLTCGGAAVWFTSRLIIGIYQSAPIGWIAGWAAPAILLCIVIGFVAQDHIGPGVIAAIAGLAAWQLAYAARFLARAPALDQT